ncbi:SCO6745 family protein [Amycolatopsis sp. CA-230715]|uniref:SCO6745 family protein n=1 Tax=Amycolatopsis sp. CA-230715 TaxID=2745196 RepID=UPI001C02B318|nr:hypothetical protein [Amycolatopsis sp. CA-230715]QWF79099.1 hypothetical protein HUW46_02506 [Amycolatopsis sp. CA-230715]
MAFGDDVAVAYRYHRVLDPLHSLGYFVPETDEALTAAGLRPGRMGYFASRSAPMGPVGPGVVTATFYNFSPELVARHIPRAWTLAAPERILAARTEAVDAAFKRLLGAETLASPDVAEAAELAREATAACSAEGRPLYAGHADLDWPSEPHLVLWHAISLLREYRGDGHIAALVEHGLGGLAALITHTVTGRGFVVAAAKKTRGWSDEEWDAEAGRLRDAGVLDEAGALTEVGEKLRADIEDATNRAAMAPWIRLGEERADRLHEIGRALSRQAVAAGAFPEGVFATPKA